MVMMLVGVSWYAYIVSSMSSIMSTFDAQNKAVRDKMLCVNEVRFHLHAVIISLLFFFQCMTLLFLVR